MNYFYLFVCFTAIEYYSQGTQSPSSGRNLYFPRFSTNICQWKIVGSSYKAPRDGAAFCNCNTLRLWSSPLLPKQQNLQNSLIFVEAIPHSILKVPRRFEHRKDFTNKRRVLSNHFVYKTNNSIDKKVSASSFTFFNLKLSL